MIWMIMSFRHKGLRDLFLHGRTSGVLATQVKRLRHRLAVISSSMAMHTYWITRTITHENGKSSPPWGDYSGGAERT